MWRLFADEWITAQFVLSASTQGASDDLNIPDDLICVSIFSGPSQHPQSLRRPWLPQRKDARRSQNLLREVARGEHRQGKADEFAVVSVLRHRAHSQLLRAFRLRPQRATTKCADDVHDSDRDESKELDRENWRRSGGGQAVWPPEDLVAPGKVHEVDSVAVEDQRQG